MEENKNLTRELYVLQTKLTVLDKRRKMISSQIATTEKALDELDKTSEKKVYKIVGNILIKKDVGDVIIELNEKKVKMDNDLSDIENQLKNDLEKYKELGAKYSINTNLQEDNYTLDSQNNIFDTAAFNNKTDS